jgi:hypothetical protein
MKRGRWREEGREGGRIPGDDTGSDGDGGNAWRRQQRQHRRQ